MKKIRIFPLLLLLCLLVTVLAPSAYAIEAPSLGAAAVYLADLETGALLYSFNENEQRAPASLTKIMTALLAIEAIERGDTTLDTIVTAQNDVKEGLSEDSSTVNITPGEQMPLEDLLYCALVHSANESCNVIASHISGSISAFVSLMNSRAAELGCTGTHFANTNGLPNDNHYSTAKDMYLIAKEAVTHSLFMTICNTSSYTVAPTNYVGERVLNNSNALISTDSIYGSGYRYDYATGVKTGFTRAAGNCLISTARKGDLHLIAVVMGCEGPNTNANVKDYGNFVDSRTIYDWAFDNYAYQTFLTVSETVAYANVALSGGDGTVALHPAKDITYLVPNDVTKDDLQLAITYVEDLTAPIEANTKLADAEIIIGGVSYGRVNLVNTQKVDVSRSEYLKLRLQAFFSNIFVRIVLVLLLLFGCIYLALVMRYRRLRRKHLQAKRAAEKRRRAEAMARQRARQDRPAPSPAYEAPTRKFSTLDPSERGAGLSEDRRWDGGEH